MTGSGGTSAADTALSLAAWQQTVFASRPRRIDLLRLKSSWPTVPLRLHIHRNQPFELIAQVLPPFLAYAGMHLEQCAYSAYDDSLTWSSPDEVDVQIVSLDFERYRDKFDSVDQLVEWLSSRLQRLVTTVPKPTLVSNWPASDSFAAAFNESIGSLPQRLHGVAICDVASLASELGESFIDERSAEIKATNWSDAAVISCAREFGLCWLPAVTSPIRKAVVVDLDGTLYDGVLGEDGVDGVELTHEHRRLQQQLVELTERGIFVAVASKNDESDVVRLLDERYDFPLRSRHISARAVGWDDKASGLQAIASQLRVGTDSLVLVDDNAGELAAVAAHHPEVRLIHASDPGASLSALRWCPGLFRFSTTEEDELRVADLAASMQRQRQTQLTDADDFDDYLRSLAVELSFRVDDKRDVSRMAELSKKTNQFNTALLRQDEATIASRISSGTLHAVMIALRDRLSDSGKIAVVFGRLERETLVIEEICISCRALGRNLETLMVEQSVRLLADLADDPVGQVDIMYSAGPRNSPALRWLESFGNSAPDNEGTVNVHWNESEVSNRIELSPVKVSVEKVDG